jgi:peptide/nickel transport system substrate-binding protein
MRKGILAALPICLLILSAFVNLGVPAFSQTSLKGPNVESVKFTLYSDENIALKAVKAGDIDAYFYRIPLEIVSDVKKDPGLAVYDRDAGSFGLLLNPAPSKDGSMLNPFQFKDVRFAMNYLVDREFVVGDVLKGSGSPMVDPFGISSPEYQDIADIVESFGFRHDFNGAEKMMSDALGSAGATKENGKWMFKGNPISIKIFIRSDDPRRNSIGEALSSDLEKIGFTVEKIYGDLSRAQLDVYGSNPQDLDWQIYTEGYAGTLTFVAYNPVVPAQMYAPWYGNMPGRGNTGWQYSNNTLDDITQKIANLNFTSKEERTDLVRQAITQGIQESVRIFIAQTKEPYVASSSVTGLVNDFGAGISSRFSLIDAKPASGNALNIGVRQLSQGAWNNIAGLKDTFSITIFSAIFDFATLKDPYLGTTIPMRENWTDVVTKGPTGSLSVPADVQKWDAYNSQWEPVGGDETTKSKATYKALYSDWHNGIPMDKNDLLYSYYFTFEWGTNTTKSGAPDLTVDPEVTPTVSASLPTLKGIRFLSDDTFESYVDVWHFDDKEIADYGTLWAAEPWEVTAAEERLVTAGKVSFSSSGAVEKGVDWLSLVNPQHAEMIRAELQKMKSEQFIPAALKGLVSAEDAIKRYDASMKWISDHKNAVISNGPFYLDSFNAEGQTATIKAFRDSSYPFEQGYWASRFGKPMVASIESVDTQGPVTIGQPKAITVSVNVAGQPSSDAQVKYLISGDKGIVAEGDAAPVQNGQFEIKLSANQTSQLSPGANTLKVFAISNKAYKLALFSTPVLASAESSGVGTGQTNNTSSNSGNTQADSKSGCLIATAAFGSELTPQVQYLRNFRQNYILETASGSAFMNTFNTIYYSFSPQVADYERGQPWLQQTVKTALYPLFGILMLSEQAHNSVSGGEAGTMLAGATASSLIGMVYIAPAIAIYTLAKRGNTKFRASWLKMLLLALGATAVAMLAGTMTHNADLLSMTTAAFVVLTAAVSALVAGIFVVSRILSVKRGREF